MRFKGTRGASYTGDASVDNIVINQGSGGSPPASPPAPPVQGQFESGSDGWTGSGKQHWTRGTSTPSSGTGPTKAASGQYFYFLETSSGTNGDISYLTSPKLVSGTNMSFYYHMHGATMGALEVEALVGNSWRTVWTKTGQQQQGQNDPWRSSGTITLPSTTGANACISCSAGKYSTTSNVATCSN